MWRSMLFVPVTVERYLRRAPEHGADAVVLDLEDGIPPDGKREARAALESAVDIVGASGSEVLVRINSPWRLAVRDLEAAVRPGVHAIVLPKAGSADQLGQLDELMSELEREAGLPDRRIRMIAMIESPAVLFGAVEIARASPRLCGLGLGAEDFAADTGTTPDSDLVADAKRTVALAAGAAGIGAYGIVGAISNYTDLPAFRAAAEAARALGHVGGYAVHPAQVPILNEVFTPGPADVDWATAVLATFEQATSAGRGSAARDGRMVDAPVARRARRVLERAAWVARRPRPE